MDVKEIANITNGITSRNEIYVINNLNIYDTFIQKPGVNKCVEYPRYPPLGVGRAGVVQNGVCKQEKNSGSNFFGSNTQELIPHRFNSVKFLLGYVGINPTDYILYRINKKDVESDVIFMNCGDNEDTIIKNRIYVADTGIGGNIVVTAEPIVSARDLTKIYQTSRISNSSIMWNIQVQENGFYKVILRFADFIDNTSDTFDITINGWKRREKLNIVDIIGDSLHRYDISFRVPTTNKNIEIRVDGRGFINGIDILKLERNDIELINVSRNDKINNKETYLFVNKQISASENTIKNKFLEIQNHILPSRDLFSFY